MKSANFIFVTRSFVYARFLFPIYTFKHRGMHISLNPCILLRIRLFLQLF